ncbi:MAG: molybdopterin-binding protein, partial [Eubacteriales bacterium]|nr:molybdopterin-binding protein [Eubacteriales bacterium]
MKLIPTREAVGHVLCHDITRIVPGEFKGVAFTKGHVVRPEDVEALLDLGKANLYVWSLTPGMVHEDDAAWR